MSDDSGGGQQPAKQIEDLFASNKESHREVVYV